MIFEDLELIWRDEKSHPSHTLDDEALRRIVVEQAHAYRRKIFWRDTSDIGTHIGTALFVLGVCIWSSLRDGRVDYERCGPLLLIAVSYIFVGLYRFASRQRQKARESKFDDSVCGNLEKLVANAEYQIDLHRKFPWWYILPVFPGYLLFAASLRDEGPEAFWFMMIVFGGGIFGFIPWHNRFALRTEHIPQKEQLAAMLAGLENGGPSVEIRAKPFKTPQVPLSRRMTGLAIALALFGMVVWFLVANFWPAEDLHAPEFDDVSGFAEADRAKLDGWLQATVERSQYPSLSVAIVRHGEIVYQRAFGYENTWTGRIATTNSAYHVASVTKAFTASLAVLLHDRGVVDLDQPVAKYLPQNIAVSDRPELGAKITLRQLAAHTSGLPRGVPGRVQSVEGRYELEPKRLYDLLAGVTLEFEPGTAERYSNLGYGLLGHALELAAGKPLNQLLQEYLCEPLKLEHTAYHVDENLAFATGYTTPPRVPERHSYRERLAGSGGLVTSAGDLAKFLAAQMQPGMFNPNALAQLHTAVWLNDGATTTHGLGWSIDTSSPVGRILSKNGGRKNCTAWIGFAPEHGVGVAVISNIGEPDVDPVGQWLLARSIPAGNRVATLPRSAKVAPFDAIRWENDLPTVHAQGRWVALVSIDGTPIESLMEFARKEYGRQARMRFGEDLPELMFAMGLNPDWEVTLGLRTEDGTTEQLRASMTKANRNQVRDTRLAGE